MKVLVITGDRLLSASRPVIARWSDVIEDVLKEAFPADALGMVIAGKKPGVDQIAHDIAMKRELLVGRAPVGGLVTQARHLRAKGLDVEFVIFHDNIFFSQQSREVERDAETHGFTVTVVHSRSRDREQVA